MKRALVLGCGLVGHAMARDLAADGRFDVTAADRSRASLDRLRGVPRLAPLEGDLGDPAELRRLVERHDVVVGAMPSRLGRATLRTVVEAGKPYADISFMAEDPLELGELARRTGAVAVVDCGLAPGLSNLLSAAAVADLDRARKVEVYVGGLPKSRRWPYEYKAPFAPSDVIEEYVRPARIRVAGQDVVREALSEPELMDFEGVGTLEAFNTDGLRSLLANLDVPDMVEKTLRYPGHAELMRVLRRTGFFSNEPIDVGGVKVRPLDVTSRLLFPLWSFEPGEEDFAVLRVRVAGEKSGRPTAHVYDLADSYDHSTGASAMARTTGYTCTVVARLLAEGAFREPGVHAPEALVSVKDRILTGLAERGVHVKHRVEA